MPFATFAAGSYLATYNTDDAPGPAAGKGQGARDLGLVEGVRRWTRMMTAHPVSSDRLGGLEIDGVYRGAACYCEMTLKEWSQAARDALWPFGATFGEVGAIGTLLTDIAGELVLSAVADTPAATNGPSQLVFRKAILSPDHIVDVPLGEVERDIAILFRCYPYLDSQQRTVWFEEI